jgi:branched-chain amino acid transport system permease protein
MLSKVKLAVREPGAIWRDLRPRFRYGIILVVLTAFLVLPMFVESSFFMNMMIFLFLFGAIGHGWNIIGGYAGQISLGHAVMFAAGAYTTAILYVYYGITPLAGIWVGAVVATVVGLGIGAVCFRLRGHYFAMVTLAAALIAHSVVLRWQWVGAATGIEYPFNQIGMLYSFTFSDDIYYYYIIGTFAALVTGGMYVLHHAKLGIYLKAINRDEEAAANAGIRTYTYKLYAMALSSFITGLGGALYAQYTLFVNPNATLRLLRNIDIIMVAIIGGVGTIAGPLVGAGIFIPIREYTRTALSGSHTGLGWVLFGFILLFISLYRPGGLLNKQETWWDK